MSRITISELKNATRNRALRRSASGSAVKFPTPMPMAASAVRRFHREGAPAAVEALNESIDTSTYWGPTGPASAVGWANSIKAKFNTYIRLASPDPRPVLGLPVVTDVSVGPNLVGVTIDVVMLDPRGYVGRHVLWDVEALTRPDAEILAGPIACAMQQELGSERVAGVEVWHLQSGTQHFVDRDTALRRLAEISAIVASYLS